MKKLLLATTLLTLLACTGVKTEVSYEIGYIDHDTLNNFIPVGSHYYHFIGTDQYLTHAYVVTFSQGKYYSVYADTSYNHMCAVLEEKRNNFLRHVEAEKQRERRAKERQDSIKTHLRLIRSRVR